jgi:CRISPR-associated protein Cas5d
VRQSERSARAWALAGSGGYDSTEDRAQRHTLALREVAYVIRADVVLRDDQRADAAKYRDQFRRRVERGQAFQQPYLGTRECVAFFGPPDGTEQPIADSTALGRMLFDLDFGADRSGRGQPLYFDAELRRGVLEVPHDLYARLWARGG